jgi:hypothetical protein
MIYPPFFKSKFLIHRLNIATSFTYSSCGSCTDLQLRLQLVPIHTKVVSSVHVYGEVYSIQYYG